MIAHTFLRAARTLGRLLRPRDVVFDVGANVGFYSILFASRVGLSGSVHAFEPVNGDAFEVERITLDDAETHVPGRIRLVKIDVEGMEPDVIAGLTRMLAAGRVDALLVEVCGDAMEQPEIVLAPLRAAGFRAWRLGAFGGRRNPGLSWDARITGLYHLLALRERAA